MKKQCKKCRKTYEAAHPQQWYCKPCKRKVEAERHTWNAEAIFKD